MLDSSIVCCSVSFCRIVLCQIRLEQYRTDDPALYNPINDKNKTKKRVLDSERQVNVEGLGALRSELSLFVFEVPSGPLLTLLFTCT